jgi:hypothetical protein
MVTRKNQKAEQPKVIGTISKYAGTFVGTAVVTGRQIIQRMSSPSKPPKDKSAQARTRKKKKTTIKTKPNVRKVKKRKKVTKHKKTAPTKKG